MAGTLEQIWIAGRLRLLASGGVDLSDEATLAKAIELLANLTPEERAEVAAKAIEMGADAGVVQSLVNMSSGEVINVSERVTRRRVWWPWLLGGLVVVGLGAFAVRRARRGRRALQGAGYTRSRDAAQQLRTLRQLTPGRRWRDFNASTVISTVPYLDARAEQRRLQALGFDVDYTREDADTANLMVKINR